jgi:putative NADH-flavin reductase
MSGYDGRKAPRPQTEVDMKLLVLGATGATGLEIVRLATERGHFVTAFVRSSQRLRPFGDRIAIQQGDLLDPEQLARVMKGHDAVLSAFGPRVPISTEDATLLQRFAVALTGAMKHAGVRRLAIESVAFLFRNAIAPPAYLLGRLLFPGIIADSAAMEHAITESGLDWTIVRPPKLTDEPGTGRYRVGEGHLPRFGFNISRADVADFLIKSVENPSAIHKVYGVSN